MNKDTKNNLKIEFLKKAKILSSLGINGIYLDLKRKKLSLDRSGTYWNSFNTCDFSFKLNLWYSI